MFGIDEANTRRHVTELLEALELTGQVKKRLPVHSPAWLASVGGNLDIFIFWTIGLLAVGYAAASSKKARFGSALAVVVVIWLVYVLAAAGLTAGFASMVPRP